MNESNTRPEEDRAGVEIAIQKFAYGTCSDTSMNGHFTKECMVDSVTNANPKYKPETVSLAFERMVTEGFYEKRDGAKYIVLYRANP